MKRRFLKYVVRLSLVVAVLASALGCLRTAFDVARAVLPGVLHHARGLWADPEPKSKSNKRYTLAERLKKHGPEERPALKALFARAGVTYPPQRIVLVGLKHERRLLVYAEDDAGIHYIKGYGILGASGKLGPKLREGDYQVPEGLYAVNFFNPNSTNHLSMRVSYPSRADRAQGRKERRTGLGGEIYIHGKTTSAGCLAMGDRAIEEIWVMAVDTGKKNIDVILSPVDFRARKLPRYARKQPQWVLDRYAEIREALNVLPPPRLRKRKRAVTAR